MRSCQYFVEEWKENKQNDEKKRLYEREGMLERGRGNDRETKRDGMNDRENEKKKQTNQEIKKEKKKNGDLLLLSSPNAEQYH